MEVKHSKTSELKKLKKELQMVEDALLEQMALNTKFEKKVRRLNKKLYRSNKTLFKYQQKSRILEKHREIIKMHENDFSASKSSRVNRLILYFNKYRIHRLRDFFGKWYCKVEEILEYEESRQSYLRAVRNTMTKSIAKKFGAMFEGVAEDPEEDDQEFDDFQNEVPDEYEEIYTKVHEDLVEHCADAHTTLVKQCSIRLMMKSLKSITNLSKKIGLEQLKINTIQSIIEGKGPINTFEGQGSVIQSSSIPENNNKSIRVTLGPSLRDAIVGRKTISDKTLVSRFYSKTGENLASKIGSSSLVQSFLSYMKEQKDSIIIEKQLRIKDILKNKYFKCISRAWRIFTNFKPKIIAKPIEIQKKSEDSRSRGYSQGVDSQRRGRNSLNSEQKAALLQFAKEEDKKCELPSELTIKDIGKFLNSQGVKNLPAKDNKSLAVKLPPRAAAQHEVKKKINLVMQFIGHLNIEAQKKNIESGNDSFDDTGEGLLNQQIYPTTVKREGMSIGALESIKDISQRSSVLPNNLIDCNLLPSNFSSKTDIPISQTTLAPIKNVPPPPENRARVPPPPPPCKNNTGVPLTPTESKAGVPPPPPQNNVGMPLLTTENKARAPPPPPPQNNTGMPLQSSDNKARVPPPPPPQNKTGVPPPPPPQNNTGVPPQNKAGVPPPPPPQNNTGAPPQNKAGVPPPPPQQGKSNIPLPPNPGNTIPNPPVPNNVASSTITAPENAIPQIKPPADVVTKKLFWDIIPKYKLKSTLWNAGITSNIPVNYEILTSIFAEKKVETVITDKPKAKVQVYITDMKKANNSGIVLSRFSYKSNDIINIINSMDEKKIKTEDLLKLIKLAPTDEEMEKLINYTGNGEEIMYSERFLLECWVRVPLFQIRLECFKFKIDFYSELPDVCEIISIISDALVSIRESESFKNIIALILSIGNYLNHGTNKGNAQGFSLNILSQLNTIRGCDQEKTPLIYFLLNSLTDRTQLNFITEFESCLKASRFEITDLDVKLSEFTKGFNLMEKAKNQASLKTEVKELKIFCSQVDSFIATSATKFNELKQAVADVKRLFEQTLELYGEDKTIKATEFFKKFSSFADMCKKAHEETSIKKGKEEMKRIAIEKKLSSQKSEVKKEITSAIRRTIRMSVKNRIQGIGKSLNK